MPSSKKGIRILINSLNFLNVRLEFAPYLLRFNEPGGTSRGVLTEKPTFFIKFYDEKNPEKFGIGEASVFPGLSPEADGNYVNKLLELMVNVALGRDTDLSHHSSILFGLEQAVYDFSNNCGQLYFPRNFTQGKQSVVINGLIWMGDIEKMIERIDHKVHEGFECIKLKIGSIDWEKELELLSYIRREYSEIDLTIRVDANGAFTPDNCMDYVNDLADFAVHSIEQPIKAGQPEIMAKICKNSPIDIALDEELIGKISREEKIKTLDEIHPDYIILKPSLCGGFSGASEWISLAQERGIDWWVTSALESNVGLNAIAQWTSFLNPSGAQGLGTGGVYSNNFETPIYLNSDNLCYNSFVKSDYQQFSKLNWHR